MVDWYLVDLEHPPFTLGNCLCGKLALVGMGREEGGGGAIVTTNCIWVTGIVCQST